jgi:hypothetical protein
VEDDCLVVILLTDYMFVVHVLPLVLAADRALASEVPASSQC